jgi:catechol-2,3-dioxygenase
MSKPDGNRSISRSPLPLKQSIGHVALLVRDYDEAIRFYVGMLGFRLVEDKPIDAQAKR